MIRETSREALKPFNPLLVDPLSASQIRQGVTKLRIPLDMTGSSDDMTKRNRLGHRRKFDAMPTCPFPKRI